MTLPQAYIEVAASRYIMSTLPFLWILLSKINILNYLIYPLIILGFIRTGYVSFIAKDNYFDNGNRFFIHLSKEHIKLPEGYTLLSQQPRMTYTILEERSFKKIEDIVEMDGRKIWIVGGKLYRSKQISKIEKLYNGREINYSDVLNDQNVPTRFNITEVNIK
jgi:hypothetical protein